MTEKYPLSIDPEKTLRKIGSFLKMHLKKANKDQYVLGLSGGIDSAVVASLVAETLGKEKLIVVKMFYGKLNPQSEKDADLIINKYNLKNYSVDISNIVDSYFDRVKEDDNLYKVRKGNFSARVRMAILFDISAKENALVLGTGNKSEILLGYTTWFGDSACSCNPIGNLYKTQVYQLARHLGIPESIIMKPPSADLWKNQTDEEEMGIKYKDADKVLYLIFDKKKSSSEAAKLLRMPKETIDKILVRVKQNEFKRKLPRIAKL